MPVLELQNASGQTLRNVSLKAAYVTHYQANLDFSNENFKNVLPGDRVVFKWPDQDDPNTISLTLHPPAALRIEAATFTPSAPVATNDPVILKITIKNEGGTRSGNFTVSWKPDPLDPQIFSVAHGALNPGEPADVSFQAYVYTRSGTISSTVSVGNGDDAKSYPVTVAAPPVEPLPERDLPGFPQTATTYGKFIGGTGLDAEYGGDCSPGYVRSSANVEQLGQQGQAVASLNGWKNPDNPRDRRIIAHYSITASSPNPSPNWVKAQIFIRERGE
jgi:hypothetical protein